MSTPRTAKRSATERLKHLVKAELTRQGLNEARAAREAQLPGSVFQSLLRLGKRPTIDRADELCTALGISMTIGVEDAGSDALPSNPATDD